MRTAGVIIGFVLLFLGTAGAVSAAIFEPGFEVETVAAGLNLPTNMAFAPDGRIFIAQKNGIVRLIKNGALVVTPVITLTDVNNFGDRGLLSITTDPDFLTNGYLYLAYTYENTPGSNYTGPKTGRIARVTVVGDVADESSKAVLLGTVTGSSATPSCKDFPVTDDCIPSDSPSHSVGGLRFGPDGKLYATLGDGAHYDFADPDSLRAQNVDSLGGKVIRINKDGTAPSDNPFYTTPTTNRSKVYALGVRNSFRLNFNPVTNQLYIGDVGWGAWEEVNRVTPGANFGWPCWEGNTQTVHNCSPAATTSPFYTYAHNGDGAGAIAMGSFPHNAAYPVAYNTSLFFGDYAQNWIKRLELNVAGTAVVGVHDFMDNPDGPVDVATGPDGNVYFLSIYTGELHRITHTAGNRRPIAVISGTPSSGVLPLTVAFSSSGSSDPDSDPISYAWNFGNGEVSNLQNPEYTYTNAGTYSTSLTVADSNGSSASKSMTITAGNQAPTATITSPANGTLYSPGQNITVTGTATDPEQGTLPPSSYHWDIILHHNTHIHIIQQFDGVTSPTFVAPDHNATDVYTEVKLTVTDAAGLTSIRSINLYINTGATTGNLVRNPSMETPEAATPRPQYWQNGFWGSMTPIFTYPVTGFDGASAARVQITSYTDGTAKWYFEPISVVGGQLYTVSDWYTATVPTILMAQYEFAGGVMQYQELASLSAVATPTKVERTVTMPANVQRFTLFHEIASVGTLVTDNYSVVAGTPTTDTTAPAVSITSPAASSTVSGSVNVTVTASDTVGVAGVSFFVDGVQTGAEDTVAPYTFVWSVGSTTGSRTLTARARDAAGNVGTSTGVNVTVAAAGQNLVTNGSFEVANGSLPQGWTQGGWGTHSRVYAYPVSGFDGNKAAQVQITSYGPTDTGDSSWTSDEIPVTPGIEYTYSDRYKATTISDVLARYRFADGSEHYIGIAKELPATSEWRQISGKFIPPQNTVGITIRHVISAPATLTLDDVSLYATGTGTPSEIIPPVATITAPAANATVSGIVTITATATDNVGVVGLFFAIDGTPITGEFPTGPYSTQWDTTSYSNGLHVIKATVRDAAGNNSNTTITVNVDNSATASAIPNPSLETVGTNGDPQSWFRGGWGTNNRTFTYPVTGVAGARAARISVTTFTSGDAKWYFSDVAVTPGTAYTVTHRYRSDAPTDLYVRYQTPAGAFQYAFLKALPLSASAWVQDTSSFTVPAGIASFTLFHNLSAVGYLEIDDFTFSGGTTTPPTDTTVPTIVWSAPAQGATITGTTTLTATATDNVGVAGVQFFVDGAAVQAEDTTSPYSISLNTRTYTNGSHTLAARARDTAGNVATSTITVTVTNTTPDTTIPTVSVTAPTGGTVSGTVTITATAADNIGVANVRFFVDSAQVGAIDTTSPYSVAWTTTSTTNGSHQVRAVARDAAGNVATSTAVTVTVSNTAPANLIQNASLETANATNPALPNLWANGKWGTNNAVFTYPITGTVGARAARVGITTYTSGDAKWYFNDVTVTPGRTYTFSESYKSTALTDVLVRYTRTDNTQFYATLTAAVPAAAAWTARTNTITIPTGVKSLTIFHLIARTGTLEIDNYSLTLNP